MEGLFLQTVEGLGQSTFPGYAGEWWQLLQAEKEVTTQKILAAGPRFHQAVAVNESEPEDDAGEDLERRQRHRLELRLRDLNDAQDRLIDGGYGLCLGCGKAISDQRLQVDPAVSLCVECQQMAEGDALQRTL